MDAVHSIFGTNAVLSGRFFFSPSLIRGGTLQPTLPQQLRLVP